MHITYKNRQVLDMIEQDFEDFEKDESCQAKQDAVDKKNKCRETWKKYTVDDKGKAISIIVVVTQANVKDVGLLKSKTDCKSFIET